ncbi:MAG TPA: hypothetical protein VGH62_13050 [Bradyrhizobium sp.]
MVVGDCRIDCHFGQRITRPSDANLRRHPDVHFKGAKGNTLSALLYIPPNATTQTPAPGVLGVHGYINSRETQDGFAIEFARRGYNALAFASAFAVL